MHQVFPFGRRWHHHGDVVGMPLLLDLAGGASIAASAYLRSKVCARGRNGHGSRPGIVYQASAPAGILAIGVVIGVGMRG